jgi:hypothetical protein
MAKKDLNQMAKFGASLFEGLLAVGSRSLMTGKGGRRNNY